jgi:hypothetical protein
LIWRSRLVTDAGRRPRILVIYAADHWPLRTTIEDHLLAAERNLELETVYFNARMRPVPRWLTRLPFDLIVFHTTLLSQRWHPPTFKWLQRRLEPIKRLQIPSVAIPQDEFLHTDALADFLVDFDVRHVLSCAPEGEWPKIYARVIDRVSIDTVLTGYLEPRTVDRIERLRAEVGEARDIDVGYRAWKAEAWLGRHGVLKTEIAGAAHEAADRLGMTNDISVDPKDTLLGDDWFRFLIRCAATIGVEGGASVLDHDGAVKECSDAFVGQHPDASFAEIEQACFPGRDGELHFFALSPRHLEACATRTLQVLVDGEYGGVLKPNVHYLPVKRDLSNLPDALDASRNRALRAEITERAYRDVVASGRYSSGSLAEAIARVARSTRPDGRTRDRGTIDPLLRVVARVTESISRWQLRTRPKVRQALARLGLLGFAMAVRRLAASTDERQAN